MTVRETCLVEAPSDLPEGYLFDATVDGITFSVTVPKGGVTRGQQFEVPYPTSSNEYPTAQAQLVPSAPVIHKTTVKRPDGTMEVITETTHADGSKTTVTEQMPKGGAGGGGAMVPFGPSVPVGGPQVPPPAPLPAANMGRWTTELCGCFDVCCSGLWWMGWCCQPILLGQIMQRMGYTIGGCPGRTKSESTCVIITVLWLICIIISFTVAAQTDAGVIILYAFFLYFLVATTCTRMEMRRKYRIPPSCCGESCCDDCCCSYWCSCCVAIQMHRHTHNTHEYPYSCGSKTGLPYNAPAIV